MDMNEHKRVDPDSKRRCADCNHVSSPDIATNLGDHYKFSFIETSTPGEYICRECFEVHQELMNDYAKRDNRTWIKSDDFLNVIFVDFEKQEEANGTI